MTDQHDNTKDLDFESPPVEEVALSIHFRPPAVFRPPYFSLFWERFRSEFTRAEEHPHLPQQLEKLDALPQPQAFIAFGNPLERMLRCLTADGSRMIQIQRDMLGVNWLRVSDDASYPRYDSMSARMAALWGSFLDFVRDLGAEEPPEPLQVEIAYVDSVPQGKSWESFGDASSIVAPWSGEFSIDLPPPESVTAGCSFLIPSGRMRVSFNPWRRFRDQKETIAISINSRVVVAEGKSITECLDLAHDWARRGFVGMTTTGAHDLWRRVR
jgi:uncharacterized protein (TIGR04255 family)